MALLIIIFSIAILCIAISFGIINGLEFFDVIDNNESYATTDKKLVRKIIFKLGLCIFGLLSGLVLFFYGIILSFM